MPMRYLLLQVRNDDDPARRQEVECFVQALGCEAADIATLDLLASAPSEDDLNAADVVLIGGSGHYSATDDAPWLHRTLGVMRLLYEQDVPTFASCWGFQAMARALGGRCVTDSARAELGTIDLSLADAGRQDPIFGPLPATFTAQAGHQDVVVELPKQGVLLASSDRCANQAFTFRDKRIYCTQFHPEMDREALANRLRNYPQYVERIAGMPLEEFLRDHCHESGAANQLLPRFVDSILPKLAS